MFLFIVEIVELADVQELPSQDYNVLVQNDVNIPFSYSSQRRRLEQDETSSSSQTQSFYAPRMNLGFWSQGGNYWSPGTRSTQSRTPRSYEHRQQQFMRPMHSAFIPPQFTQIPRPMVGGNSSGSGGNGNGRGWSWNPIS